MFLDPSYTRCCVLTHTDLLCTAAPLTLIKHYFAPLLTYVDEGLCIKCASIGMRNTHK